ncbi:leucine-rich repeat domain-containing protein [Rhodotorula paludigena]|uniref:leucine-rich repeat domain-containing protein n=1 Tax=Rhodotorula paludigena TaxID=86838 RepID=UPI003181DF9A
MSTPRTPQKLRAAGLDEPAPRSSRPVTPARDAVARTKATAGTIASPQIRAALAALRKKREASSDSTSNSLLDEPDPFSVPAPQPSAPKEQTEASAEAGPSRAPTDDGEVLLEWNVKDEGRLIEAAKKSGRLNLAARSLTAIPPALYSSLLPRSSRYHPSNRDTSHFRQERPVDLTISRGDDDEGQRETTWYEQQDLRSLNLSNNELATAGDELGGFDELENLDLHNNLLSTLPSSIGYLVNLTSLSLSHNRLSTFPAQILNLRHLRELSLASNELTSLWRADWRAQLDDALVPPDASPSATPESAHGRGESFWDSFPSSPFKRSEAAATAAPVSKAPFPLLTSLSLSNNPLAADTFSEPGFELPPRLVSLDLAGCGLTDSAVPPNVFGTLRSLQELDLSKNDLGDDLFSPALFPPAAPSASPSPLLFPALTALDLSLNPLDSLASLEHFFLASVQRPIAYTGLPHVVSNLVQNEERRTGRRIGVPPQSAAEGGSSEATEVQVRVVECMLRSEQSRRRAKFAPTATSLAREAAESKRAQASGEGPGDEERAHEQLPARPASRRRSPSPPASPSPASAPHTPSRTRRPVVLEDWEVEAAAGLSTPAGRRKAAAALARERDEAERARVEEELRTRREKEVEAERERERAQRKKEEQEQDELLGRKMREMQLGEKRDEVVDGQVEPPTPSTASTFEPDEQSSPPPYSPRSPTSPALVTAPAAPGAPATLEASESAREADSSDPAVELISSALVRSAAKTAVALSSRSLADLPVPSTGSAPSALSSPTHVDLSRNTLLAVPLSALATWGWASALRVLTLSNNRIAALEVLSTASQGVLFPSLDSLDLSSNYLPSLIASPFPPSATPSHLASLAEGDKLPLLAVLASLAPTVSTLTLRANRLTTLSGISSLVLPSADASSGARGIRRLDLAENKICDVEELCAVGERYEQGERGAWRCEELDLAMNDIARLPPQLGHLPDSLVLHLVGNKFRFPRPEVYENAGQRLVIPWLRERL